MQQVLSIILPVFGLIGIGWLAARFRALSHVAGAGLSSYVIKLAIPVLIFRTLSTGQLPHADPWNYWLAYFTGVAVVWVIAMAAAQRIFGTDRTEAVIYGFCAGQSNTVQLGIPLIVTVYGDDGAVPLFLLIAVHLPLVMTLATIQIAHARGESGVKGLLRGLRTLAVNPIIIGILLGGLAKLLDITASGAIAVMIDQISASAAPVALITMGIAIDQYGLRGHPGPLAMIVLLKMIVHPAIVWFMAFHVLDMPPMFSAVAVLFAALPSGVNSYLVAVQYKSGEALSAGSVSLTTMVSLFTMSFWLWLSQMSM